jgi:hypothetical protein
VLFIKTGFQPRNSRCHKLQLQHTWHPGILLYFSQSRKQVLSDFHIAGVCNKMTKRENVNAVDGSYG